MNDKVIEKLKILSGSAKYDVSCASSGTKRNNNGKGLGNAAAWGICHSFTEDGRCVALLKVMLTNHCIYDCAYCISRRSNDVKRATFTVEELTDITIGFYRRNYIEGLFLSSGVLKNPDYTMERMVRVAKDLRLQHRYNGYIHLKAIPGASENLIRQAGLYADRLSVNMEIPTEKNLKYLAPDKNYKNIMTPMELIHDKIAEYKTEKKQFQNTPRFTPAGQSTQLIIGATDDSDLHVLDVSSRLYKEQKLKRVYYSGYLPVNDYDKRLPAIIEPPLKREHRLYQADWLFRFYHFEIHEIVNEKHPYLDLQFDPKLAYALRNPWMFPVDINTAPYETILRVPGIGTISAQKILLARKHRKLNSGHLKKIGVVMKRAKYFITCNELNAITINEIKPENVRKILLEENPLPVKKGHTQSWRQLSLFGD